MGTPVSDKFCLCISPVVPTGTLVSDLVLKCLRVLLYLIKFSSTYGYSRIDKVSISPVVPMGTLVSVNKYKFFSTYEYSRIHKISISPVVPTSTSV